MVSGEEKAFNNVPFGVLGVKRPVTADVSGFCVILSRVNILVVVGGANRGDTGCTTVNRP